jgi:hypothetical protein
VHAVLSQTEADLFASLVWIHMLRTDSLAAAEAEAAALSHSRLQHFHDPRRRLGKAIGGALGTGRAVVWDTYLFYAPRATWIDEPPPPIDWAHQVRAGWADPARFRWKDDLTTWLEEVVSGIAGGDSG